MSSSTFVPMSIEITDTPTRFIIEDVDYIPPQTSLNTISNDLSALSLKSLPLDPKPPLKEEKKGAVMRSYNNWPLFRSGPWHSDPFSPEPASNSNSFFRKTVTLEAVDYGDDLTMSIDSSNTK